MPLPTFVPPVLPSPGTSHKPEINLWEAEFGDGYSQATPKGVNHIRKKTSLNWKVLTTEQMREIVGFFERMGGHQPFYFKPFGEPAAVKWTCKEWSPSTDAGIWTVTAELSQSFTNEA